MTTHIATCPYCGQTTTARKARSHQRACPQRPMSWWEIVQLALSITDTCDISTCPEAWLEDYLFNLATRKGRTVYRGDIQLAIPDAIQEYYRRLSDPSANP